MKIFGVELFNFSKNKGQNIIGFANHQLKDSKYLPDFYTIAGNAPIYYAVETSNGKLVLANKKTKKKTYEITPKGIYEMKMLNEKNFVINTETDYIESQLKTFKEKLSLVKMSEYDYTRGVTEIQSVVVRMENRKKYPEFEKFFSQFPYTKTTKIKGIIGKNEYLKFDKVEQFLADLPKEAIKIMSEYKNNTEKLCGKFPLFYILAKKSDFEKTERRKDPILFAQSPFGHFWQILGAWDEEMLFLEEL